jgi:hypothetical protein
MRSKNLSRRDVFRSGGIAAAGLMAGGGPQERVQTLFARKLHRAGQR